MKPGVVRVGECIVPCYSCASMTRHREAAQHNRRVDLERLANPIISPGLPRSVTPAAMCLARPKYRAKSKPAHPSIHPSILARNYSACSRAQRSCGHTPSKLTNGPIAWGACPASGAPNIAALWQLLRMRYARGDRATAADGQLLYVAYYSLRDRPLCERVGRRLILGI